MARDAEGRESVPRSDGFIELLGLRLDGVRAGPQAARLFRRARKSGPGAVQPYRLAACATSYTDAGHLDRRGGHDPSGLSGLLNATSSGPGRDKSRARRYLMATWLRLATSLSLLWMERELLRLADGSD